MFVNASLILCAKIFLVGLEQSLLMSTGFIGTYNAS